MPVVDVDINKMEQELIPAVNNALAKLATATNTAGTVLFPNGEFNWSSTVEYLRDCHHSLKIFQTWIQGLDNSMKKNITLGVESLEKLSMEAVQKKE